MPPSLTTMMSRKAKLTEVPSRSITRDDILATIRANEARLRELSVRELALFVSFARGEETDASDMSEAVVAI
jgi:hypothetical protein